MSCYTVQLILMAKPKESVGSNETSINNRTHTHMSPCCTSQRCQYTPHVCTLVKYSWTHQVSHPLPALVGGEPCHAHPRVVPRLPRGMPAAPSHAHLQFPAAPARRTSRSSSTSDRWLWHGGRARGGPAAHTPSARPLLVTSWLWSVILISYKLGLHLAYIR